MYLTICSYRLAEALRPIFSQFDVLSTVFLFFSLRMISRAQLLCSCLSPNNQIYLLVSFFGSSKPRLFQSSLLQRTMAGITFTKHQKLTQGSVAFWWAAQPKKSQNFYTNSEFTRLGTLSWSLVADS